MTDQHTVRSYDNELKDLTSLLLQMGDVVQDQLRNAANALLKGDTGMAASVVERDIHVDEWENKVDAEVVAIVARRQPMARDLRLVISAGRMASNLERIGDHAKNIGKRAIRLGRPPQPLLAADLRILADAVQSMVHDVCEAFADNDDMLAQQVWQEDKRIDILYEDAFQRIVETMQREPSSVEACSQLLFVVKGLERIGDHATNIAEEIRFMMKGEIPTATRET